MERATLQPPAIKNRYIRIRVKPNVWVYVAAAFGAVMLLIIPAIALVSTISNPLYADKLVFYLPVALTAVVIFVSPAIAAIMPMMMSTKFNAGFEDLSSITPVDIAAFEGLAGTLVQAYSAPLLPQKYISWLRQPMMI